MKSPIVKLSGFVLAMTMISVPFTADAGFHGGPDNPDGRSSENYGYGGPDSGDQGSDTYGYGGQGSDGMGPGGDGMGPGGNGMGPGGDGMGMSNNGGSEFRALRILQTLDLDGSNDLSLDEFLAKPTGFRTDRFDRLDADNDELISNDEYLDVQRGGFYGMDIDFDALRTCIEEQNGSGWMSPPDRQTHFVEMDVNADGFVDRDEYETARLDRATERFMLIDTDLDGLVTETELIAALGDVGQHHATRRECINEQRDLDSLQGS